MGRPFLLHWCFSDLVPQWNRGPSRQQRNPRIPGRLCRMGFEAPLQKVEHPCRFLSLFSLTFSDSLVTRPSCILSTTSYSSGGPLLATLYSCNDVTGSLPNATWPL